MSLVTVATFTTPFEAEIVKGRLEEEGVTAVVRDAEMVTADWTMSQAVGGVKVRVPEAEVERARAILAEEASSEDADPIPEAEDLAWRALQASAVGLALPPLHLYAAYLLVRYARLSEGKTPKTQRRAVWAIVFLVPYVALIGVMVGVGLGG